MKDPLRTTGTLLVVSGDVYHSVVGHGTFRNLVNAEIAGIRFPGWIRVPADPR
jgi:hypothetical protein